jgi:hypothetical protein
LSVAGKEACAVAIYHLSIKIIGRGKGQSAVSKAAYRAGEKIISEHDGRTNDYTRKGGVVHTEILLPENAPRGYADRSALWNAVEKAEKNDNAQLAREIEISLPVEFSLAENISLVRGYVREQFVNAGMCADICVHDTGKGNPHAHVMLTVRPFDGRGEWAAKSRKEYILDDNGERVRLAGGAFKSRKVSAVDWNDQTKAEVWRAAWADAVNAVFERQNSETRIDHRSYERQGIDLIPTVTLGVAASQMEKRGIRTERGNRNREIEVSNKLLRQIRARVNRLNDWLKNEAGNPTPPTLQDVFSEILNGGENRTRWQQIADLKTASEILIFLQENGITEVTQLGKKMSDLIGETFVAGDKLKRIDRRLKTLDRHIGQGENFRKYRRINGRNNALREQYEAAKKQTGFGAGKRAQKALDTANEFYESNRTELTLFAAAERYLKDVLQKRYDPAKLPPLKKWSDEREALRMEKGGLNTEYRLMKDEIREVEIIRKYAEEVQRTINLPQKTRGREMEI